MNDPAVVASADQIGALTRDKVYQMRAALDVTGWDTVAHSFEAPDGDMYRLLFDSGEFYLRNLNDETETVIILNLDALGVAR